MRLFPLAAAVILTLACAHQTDNAYGRSTSEIMIFAAASLANAFPEIADAFIEEHPGASVTFNFSGSQRLRTQLEFGAGADVFASADRRQMDLAVGAGLIEGDPLPFAGNSLVVIAPVGGETNDGKTATGLDALAGNGVKIALALQEVPVGGYSRDLLRNLETDVPSLGPGYASRVLDNVVTLEPNVRGVLQKVVLGEVDAGIVYRTDAATENAAGKVAVMSVPHSSNIVAEYPIAVLRGAADSDLATEFVRFVLDERSQAILSSYGFESPEKGLPASVQDRR